MRKVAAGERAVIHFTLNGRTVSAQAEAPHARLADLLRHVLKQYGTHVGCEHGICGACTVLVDGRAVRSCLIFAAQIEGASVVTVEGLAAGDDELNDLQKSISRASRGAMRLLHRRHSRLRDPVFARECRSNRASGARHAFRPSLPLHGICRNCRRDPCHSEAPARPWFDRNKRRVR